MAINITGIGLSATVVASKTFPAGFTITEFPDDTDPADSEDLEIAESAPSLNGDLVVWGKPTKRTLTLNVIPTSDSDKNLEILFKANTNTKSHKGANDVVTIILSYADGTTKTFVNGACISYTAINKVAQSGRISTKQYVFNFEDSL